MQKKKPSVAKKRLLRKKFKRHYLCPKQKLAYTQTIGSAFLESVHKVENSKYEDDLLKIIDCFVVGFGFVNSDLVNFSINFFLIFHLISLMCLGSYQKKLEKKKTHRCQKICKKFSNM